MQNKTNNKNFDVFLKSPDTVRILKDNKVIFSSREKRLSPLMEYATNCIPYKKDVTVFDRVVGNGLLCCSRKSSVVRSSVGSAVKMRYAL